MQLGTAPESFLPRLRTAGIQPIKPALQSKGPVSLPDVWDVALSETHEIRVGTMAFARAHQLPYRLFQFTQF